MNEYRMQLFLLNKPVIIKGKLHKKSGLQESQKISCMTRFLFILIQNIHPVNSDKKGLFTPDERVNLLRRVVKGLDNVEVDSSHTLLADYAKSKGASCIVKGLRAMSDFEAEFQMATLNRKLNPELDTVFLTACQDYTYLSSSIVKEMARYNVKLEGFVSPLIEEDVNRKMSEQLSMKK